MTMEEIIASLEDQAQDKDRLAGGDPESIFTHDADVLMEAAKLLRVMQEAKSNKGPQNILKMRRCTAAVWENGKKIPVECLFHQWVPNYEDCGEAGIANYTVALVELDNGHVMECIPDTVVFIDKANASATTQNNPLTLEELQEMDDADVWVAYPPILGGHLTMHALVEVTKETGVVWLTNNLGCRSTFDEISEDGALVYRRKPEEADDGEK